MKYKYLIQAIELKYEETRNELSKCHVTIKEKHDILNNLKEYQKINLMRISKGFESFDETEYLTILENGDEEEIFQYEKQIFDLLTKRQRDNIIQYCTSLDNFENSTLDYDFEDIVNEQIDLQESQGYSEEFIEAIQGYWVNGWYEEMQHYLLDKNSLKNVRPDVREQIKQYTETMTNYLDNESIGIEYDTVLYRGGQWDTNLKVGDVKETELMFPTTYSKKYAEECRDEDSKYLIKIYAPYGTKGIMVDSPSLADELYDEYEFLMNKNQKYIVLDVNDADKTATIQMIN